MYLKTFNYHKQTSLNERTSVDEIKAVENCSLTICSKQKDTFPCPS